MGFQFAYGKRLGDVPRIQALFSQCTNPAQSRFFRRALHKERQIVAAVVDNATNDSYQAGRELVTEPLQQRVLVDAADETPLGRTTECQLMEESLEGVVKARLLVARLGECQG